MLAILRRLRLARLLAVLAILVMAGLGQHLHAAEAPGDAGALPATTLAAPVAGGGEDGGQAVVADTHCAACHLVRATPAAAGSIRQPAFRSLGILRPADSLQPDLARPEGPTRPPRRAAAV
ncbi:hypothetical protein [Paracraurococcus ruber]|uniref:Cytochrome c domain-containing protein n=1 Tax=Paracraurococcus ruber TaxID=77675 RepID=A0ABS1CVI3_9PROT|nr:hypothetical protein [Paracraurococcus ruber]MBK1658530.1 hypothetical protein [Paracraurococcus ruber]TDG33167.1 hypothetical protein E2C05_04760 [Paracraurococcus ruber]